MNSWLVRRCLHRQRGQQHAFAGQYYTLFTLNDNAFVTLDGRALCSRNTLLLRSGIQRPSGPRGVG